MRLDPGSCRGQRDRGGLYSNPNKRPICLKFCYISEPPTHRSQQLQAQLPTFLTSFAKRITCRNITRINVTRTAEHDPDKGPAGETTPGSPPPFAECLGTIRVTAPQLSGTRASSKHETRPQVSAVGPPTPGLRVSGADTRTRGRRSDVQAGSSLTGQAGETVLL